MKLGVALKIAEMVQLEEGRELGAEERMILRMIERGILDLADRRAGVKRVTRGWFLSKGVGAFSFLWCCEVLDLEAKDVLRRISEAGWKLY